MSEIRKFEFALQINFFLHHYRDERKIESTNCNELDTFYSFSICFQASVVAMAIVNMDAIVRDAMDSKRRDAYAVLSMEILLIVLFGVFSTYSNDYEKRIYPSKRKIFIIFNLGN